MIDILVFIIGFFTAIGGGLLSSFVLTLVALACLGKCTEKDIKADENDGLIWTMAINFFLLSFYTLTFFLIRSHYGNL